MSDYIKREDGFYQPKDYEGCRNCKYQPEPLRMCEYGENRDFLEIVCSKWEKKMTDYIKTKEYKLPNGRTVTADFNELGETRVTIEAMDYLMDMINSLVEVVRCKDCRHYKRNVPCVGGYYNGCDEWIDEGNPITVYDNDFCSYGERAEE